MVTMADVAVAAGVSRSTVSLVLNDRYAAVGICAETVARVKQVALDLGYRRNEVARAMITGRNPFPCLLACHLADELSARCLAAAVAEAGRLGHYLHVLSPGDDTTWDRAIERCIELRPSGVMAWSLPADAQARLAHELARYDIPLVALQPYFGGQPLAPALDHLFELGHRRIALAAIPAEPALEASFVDAVRAASLSLPPEHVVRAELDSEDARGELRDLLRGRKTRPTAICCTSDAAALLVYRAARRAELRVPKDLSVVGYGNAALGAVADPPLTSVAPPVAELATQAVRRLLGQPALPTAGEGQPRLVVRRSTERV